MKCDYCNAEIPTGTEFISDGRYYCNALHSRWWQEQRTGRSGMPPVSAGVSSPQQGVSAKLWIAIGTAIFIAIGSFIGTKVAGGLFSSGASIDDQLMKVASEVNKSCPLILDKETRLDNTIAGVGKMFIYNYTLVNMTAAEVNVPALQAYIRPRVVNTAKTSPEMKYFRDNAVTLVYRYSDKNGSMVMEVKVPPEEYR